MSFGQRLRTRRKELGISQGELAKALGVSLSAVRNYETGHNAMREDVLLRLFSVLDVDPNYLYQDDFENKGPACGPEELQLLNKYRELDTGGRQALPAVADALCACQSDWQAAAAPAGGVGAPGAPAARPLPQTGGPRGGGAKVRAV